MSDLPIPGELIPFTTTDLYIQPFLTRTGLQRLDVDVPELETFDKIFKHRSRSFIAEGIKNENGVEVLITDSVQNLGLSRFLEYPLAPSTYYVSADWERNADHYVLFLLTYWLHHAGCPPRSVLWVDPSHSFKELHERARKGEFKNYRCLVVTGLRNDVPSDERWYLRGLMTHFRGKFRLISITGTDAYSFGKKVLGVRPTSLLHAQEPEWENLKSHTRRGAKNARKKDQVPADKLQDTATNNTARGQNKNT